KYDNPVDDVVRAIAKLKASPRGRAIELDERRAIDLADRLAARYRDEVMAIAPLVRAVADHVPRRRMRKLHIGLFGYARQANGMSLPRTIPFVASLYGVGLPPEVLGLSSLSADDLSWLRTSVPCFDADLRDAVAYLDPARSRYRRGHSRGRVERSGRAGAGSRGAARGASRARPRDSQTPRLRRCPPARRAHHPSRSAASFPWLTRRTWLKLRRQRA
ncbi:MAG: hypothetical protein E6I87_12695, partial [Chloroflexi bacterium]